MTSHKHCQVVLNALNKAHVSIETSLEDLVGMIVPNKLANDIIFTEQDLPPGGGDTTNLYTLMLCVCINGSQ